MRQLFKIAAYIWATGFATWFALGLATGESAAFTAAAIMGVGCAACIVLYSIGGDL
jgi:hypothetical protein